MKYILLFLIFLQSAAGWQFSASGGLTAVYRSGQVFLTWDERPDISNEIYRVYRSTAPIDALNLAQAERLAELAEGSATFYANRYQKNGSWDYRYLERYVIADGEAPLPAQRGLYVFTARGNESGYYAVTVTPQGEVEQFNAGLTVGPVDELAADPLPVHTGLHPSEGAHVLIQYMDAARWNPSFHAPNSSNGYYGLSPSNARFVHTLQYAYDYVVVEPQAANCGGSLPAAVPVVVWLHGFGFNMYEPYDHNAPPYCAYFIYPYDQSETWWFGFARQNDYRVSGQPAAGDVVVNYTEQRVLRMIYDLLRSPVGAAAADANRVYVYGHSMGGSGTLALAWRYPEVFAAAYASQPMTNLSASTFDGGFFIQDAAVKWGTPALNLPVELQPVHGWGSRLAMYDGAGVWDWQNHQRMLPLRHHDIAPLGVAHGTDDQVVDWQTQAVPFYPLLDAANQTWAGAITENEHHDEKFNLLPPTLAIDEAGVPFAGLQAVRNESLPGFSNTSSNPPWPNDIRYRYHTGVRWAASWDAWDEPPLDSPTRWEISLCAVNPLQIGAECGSGSLTHSDITARRLQNFSVVGWYTYQWENHRVSDNALVASGSVPTSGGLLTIPQFEISPQGNRLIVYPAADQPAAVFIPCIMR